MFTAQELEAHLARIEHERRKNDLAAMEDDEAPFENPAAALERTREFDLIPTADEATTLLTVVPPIYLIRGASRTPTGPPALVMAPSSL